MVRKALAGSLARLRFVTWNCRQALGRKRHLLEGLRPDVVVVPECSARDLPAGRSIWAGTIPNKGLGVYSASAQPRLLPEHDERLRWFLPVEIDGEQPVTVLAVWAFNHRDGLDRCSTLATAVHRYRNLLLQRKVLILGDINSNATWDGPRKAPFADAVSALRNLGYVSAYHHFFEEPFGAESQPTHRHSSGGTYHVDFCFLPTEWMRNATLDVPSNEQWHVSDHYPLVLDLDLT